MIRDLQCNGFKLKALKNDSISKYEILLPENYRIIYGGEEYCYNYENGKDIHIDVLYDKGFNDRITVINLNPRVIQHHYFGFDKNNRDIELEKFKEIVSACFVAHITFDESHKLDGIMYSYKYGEDDLNDTEDLFLFDDEDRDGGDHVFARERY